MELKKKDLIIIVQILANMLRMYGIALLAPAMVAYLYGEMNFMKIFLYLGMVIFGVFWGIHHFIKADHAGMKHAIISLFLAWITIGTISAIPFLAANIPLIDAFFESMSGWTGSGFTMIPDPGTLPNSINFFRGFIQWIGGFGIVILALLLYERPKTAYILFQAEGRSEDFFIDILGVARMIVSIYIIYTIVGTILLVLSGMGFFDALFHAMTALSTGGFSTNAVGVGHYGFMPLLITIAMMYLGGISFMSHYELFKLRFKKFFFNPEIRYMFIITIIASLVIGLELYITGDNHFFDGLFYVVSALTGTGAVTNNALAAFPPSAILVLILLMVSGACYGSTTGALKLWRLLIIIRTIRREVIKTFLPRHSVVPVKLGGHVISDEVALKAATYMLMYGTLVLVGSMIFMFSGFSMIDSIFTIASAQGNVGLNIISTDSYFTMNPLLKLLMTFHMLLGRLEIFPFLVFLRSFVGIKRGN